MVKEFSRQYLMDELDLPLEAVENNIVGNSRWSIYHEIVFQDRDGKFYQTTYSVGATECQDEGPWEYEDLIKCAEVEKKQVLVEKWVPVGADIKD